MKKLLVLFWTLFLSVFFCANTFASSNFVIKKYNMNIDVKPDKTFSITEKILIDAYAPMHGIYRVIPIEGRIKRSSGNEKYKAKLRNISVNEQYSANHWYGSGDDAYREIKIGNPNSYIEGEKEYIIKYDYRMSADKLKNEDEFYFNLIGSQWEVPISNFSFKITMPKEFDKNELWFYTPDQSTNSVKYYIKGTQIQGIYTNKIEPGQALTIHLKLPENYFEKTFFDNYFDDIKYLPFLLPIIFLIIIGNMWYKHGKDDEIIETVEFEPPDGVGPLDVAYIYRQSVMHKDVATLLIHLANKGYLSIEELDSGRFHKDYQIKKLKDYTENDVCENKFFHALFNGDDEIRLSELEDDKDFADVAQSIIKVVEEDCKSIFDKTSIKMQKIAKVLMIATWVLMAIYISSITMIFMVIHLTVFPIIGYSVLSSGVRKKFPAQIIFGVFWSFVTVVVLGAFIVAMNPDILGYIGLTAICVILMDIFRTYMPKWTKEGLRLRGKILGFKNYLEKVEVDRLQKLVDNDPKYFYRIIPYAYIFGLSDKWFKKFENITCPPPEYYSGTSFNAGVLTGIMSSSMSTMTSACTPSGGSGGGFGGGGGCSGGGGGGGGGGGW